MSEHRLSSVELDAATLPAATAEIEHERRVAIFDLVEKNSFEPAGAAPDLSDDWTDGMTPMMEARAIKNVDEQECLRMVGAIGDGALQRQREAIREGHCGLLPDTQIAPMTRIQIARDKAMAQTLAEAHRSPGTTALLITGAGHTLRTAGVPVHLPKDLTVRIVVALQHKAPTPEGASSETQTAQPSHSQQATADAVGRLVPADADLVWTSPWRDAPDHCEALRKQLE